MCEYLLNVEVDLYGPYHSEEQARYARYLFTTKHPEMADLCSIHPVSDVDYMVMIDPRQLH